MKIGETKCTFRSGCGKLVGTIHGHDVLMSGPRSIVEKVQVPQKTVRATGADDLWLGGRSEGVGDPESQGSALVKNLGARRQVWDIVGLLRRFDLDMIPKLGPILPWAHLDHCSPGLVLWCVWGVCLGCGLCVSEHPEHLNT